MSGGGRGGALSTDPFESILATARGIGFDIPEPENSVEDVQCASFMANLLQLVESGGSIPDLKSALTLLERNRVWDGLYDIETIRGYTRMLQHMSSLAVSLTKQRLTLANKLTSENAKIGIPVELEHQNTFKQLIRTIARDKYKLYDHIAEAKTCVELQESVISWKSQLESLRHVHNQLEAVTRISEDMKNMFAPSGNHTRRARQHPQSQGQSSPRDVVMKDA